MTSLEMLAVLGAGLGAGVLTSTVGVASLLSFPVLLAIGLPPVVANASNTVGLVPAGVSGSIGYRAELREHPRITWTVMITCAVGALGGAALLLALPSSVFEAVVPWLILFTCLLVGAQPWVTRAQNELRTSGRPRRSRDPHVTPTALTPQEGEIASRAASGLTNKQIAQQLHLSPRTVSGHLYRIFPKLGISTRAALRDALTPHATAE